VPADTRLVLSPADGKVIVVAPAPVDPTLGPGAMQISIFLSVFDVHINRAPIGGRVTRVRYHAGEFLPAWDDKASLRNEQNAVTVEDEGIAVEFKQIAGLIARRIVFKKREGDTVAAGERVGMIKFGSRVDVFVPASVTVRVRKGDRVRGGLSILGDRP
jgi:phosphatidylserine decarboxylase